MQKEFIRKIMKEDISLYKKKEEMIKDSKSLHFTNKQLSELYINLLFKLLDHDKANYGACEIYFATFAAISSESTQFTYRSFNFDNYGRRDSYLLTLFDE